MFKMLRGAIAALAVALVPIAATAQPVHPALWVVRKADTTVYLFGTVHALKPGLGWFDGAVRDAFDKSDELMLEVVEPDPAQLQAIVLPMATSDDGIGLTQKLPANVRGAYAATLTGLGLPPAAFDRLKPWFAAVTLAGLELKQIGFDPQQGAEQVLGRAARSAGKSIGGFESVQQQLGLLSAAPPQAQMDYLTRAVVERDRLPAVTATMFDEWSRGDADALAGAMNAEFEQIPGLVDRMVTSRNARWADWIEHRLTQPGAVFVAVGAGHLGGAGSVQAMLAKHGFKVERLQ